MMAPPNLWKVAIAAWVVTNSLLIAAIGNALDWGKGSIGLPPGIVEHAPTQVEIALYPDFSLQAVSKAYSVTSARPLFVPSRRPAPAPPPPPPPPPPTMQKGQFQLLGTTITDEMKIAIIKEISSGKERQVVEGYTVNGLLLEVVEADHIVFSQHDDQEMLRLRIQRSPKPVVVAPQAQQSPAQATARSEGVAVPTPRSGRSQASVARESRVDSRTPIAPPPQTVEDRKNNPLFKDFYK